MDYRFGQAESLLSESRSRLEDKRGQLAQISQERLECSETLSSEKQRRSALASRRELLDEMERNLEGVDQGVRHILQERERARQAVSDHAAAAGDMVQAVDQEQAYYYVRGIVADCLRAQAEYAHLVETALGSRSQYLLADSAAAVLEDQQRLEALPGRVCMICMDRLEEMTGEPLAVDPDTHPTIRARMSDLVQCQENDRPVANALLGTTWLVDDLAAAMELQRHYGRPWRWITLAGQILEADGTIHAGPPSGLAGLISRKSELQDLTETLEQCDQTIAHLQEQMTQYGAQENHLEKNLQEMRTVIYETSTEQVELKSRIEQCDQNMQRLQQEQPLVCSELNGLEDQIQQTLTLQEAGRQNLAELETVNVQRQEQLTVLEERIRQLDSEDQVMAEQITELKVAVGQTRQKRLAAGERINGLKSQIQQVQHNIGSLQNELSGAEDNMSNCQRGILAAESAISELYGQRQEHQESCGVLRTQRDTLGDEKLTIQQDSHQQQQQAQELQETLHNVQMALNETRLKTENMIQRAMDEVGLDLDAYYRTIQERINAINPRPPTRIRISRPRRKIVPSRIP